MVYNSREIGDSTMNNRGTTNGYIMDGIRSSGFFSDQTGGWLTIGNWGIHMINQPEK